VLVVDLHAHVLPGLDDGARDLDEAVEMVRTMARDGTRIVAATPHVRDDYPTSPDQMEAALGVLQAAVGAARIEIEVRGGAEIAISALADLDADALARFGLGGNPQLLLLEMPYYGWPLSLPHQCARLLRSGIVPVLAHPERNATVAAHTGELTQLVRSGLIVQLTAAAVDGRLGRSAASLARLLLDLELAHLISSDAHSPEVREAGLSAAAASVGGDLGHWLTSAVPAALLAGEPLPARPRAKRRRPFLRRRPGR
jgi:protein-tyrosine phosphatase